MAWATNGGARPQRRAPSAGLNRIRFQGSFSIPDLADDVPVIDRPECPWRLRERR
jgi:hypothetical protein